MGENLIQKKSFDFAIGIIRLYRKLQARQELIVSPQLLRSGTSIGIRVEQASTARDHQTYTTKILDALDDARETKYWLRLLKESKLADVDVSSDLDRVEEIIAVLTAMVSMN